MNPFAFLGIFLIACGIMVIFSTTKGSGKAGMAKVDAELKQTVRSGSGRFLFTEYTFTYKGESKTVKCPNKAKSEVGERSLMYYDVSKNVLYSQSAHRFVLIIGALCIILGILVIYFQSFLTTIFG